MSIGWPGSVITHGLVLLALLISWSGAAQNLPPASAVVPVEIIDTIADRTNVRAAAPEPDPMPEAQNVIPDGAAQSLTQPTPEAAEPVPDPRQKEKLKEQQRRPVTNLNDLAALIDRSKQREGQRNQNVASAETSAHARDRIGAGTDMAATESDAIKSAIERNRQRFIDLPNYERLVVTIRVQINADGSLAGRPQVISTSLPQSDPYMRVAVERSMRAILVSEPLPVAHDRTARATFTMRFYDRD